MRTFSLFQHGNVRFGEWIQPAVPDKPVSRRRIPNVIRRRHSGFRHSRHRTCKGTCRHSGNRKKRTAQGKGGKAGISTEPQFTRLEPVSSPANTTDDTGSSCTRGPYQVFKGMCRPDESPEQKVARPHMHEGPKFKIQYSSLVLSQATTWFRTEVLLYLSGL